MEARSLRLPAAPQRQRGARRHGSGCAGRTWRGRGR